MGDRDTLERGVGQAPEARFAELERAERADPFGLVAEDDVRTGFALELELRQRHQERPHRSVLAAERQLELMSCRAP